MQSEWGMLGTPAPTALVNARLLTHHAAQWATRTARANLAAAPDDSHSSLDWDAAQGALFSRPISSATGEVRIGLRVGALELIAERGGEVLDAFSLDRKSNAMAGSWADATLRGLGLKPASSVVLPYAMPDHPVAGDAPYDFAGEARALQELSRWFGAAAEVLGEVRARLSDLRPGPGPVRCWPHHFDIATLVGLEHGHAEEARSIGIGVSPGDDYYAQPYAYVSPWPRLDAARLPQLPAPGHWHTRDFVAAVATGEEILTLQDRSAGLLAFITAAFGIGRARLGA